MHEANADDARADIVAVKAVVDIDPGGPLEISVGMQVTAPVGQAIDPVVFTLNPGLTVASVESNGAEIGFQHERRAAHPRHRP